MQRSDTTSHLSAERLAAFDDAPFSGDELAHLAACADCRAEHDAVVAVVGMARGLGAQPPAAEAPRLVEFDTIMAGLRVLPASDERSRAYEPGDTTAESRRVFPIAGATPRRWQIAPLMRRAAAAVLLVGSGALVGRVSGGTAAFSGGVMGSAGATPVTTVANTGAADRPFADQSYGSVEQATAALNQAQREYERASLWLASNDSTVRDPEVFRARLAALDQMMEASRVALRDAPQDPVLNHYYLAAYSAREATLQALGSALPVDKTIERY